MAVEVKTDPVFQRATPHALVDAPSFTNSNTQFRYDVARDGKRLLLIIPAFGGAPATVVLNWEAGLKR